MSAVPFFVNSILTAVVTAMVVIHPSPITIGSLVTTAMMTVFTFELWRGSR